MNTRRVGDASVVWLLLSLMAGTLAFFGSTPRAIAQESRGTITGEVFDSSGAVVPGASVTVTNMSTQFKNEAKTNDQGNYTVPFIAPGRYKVSVGAPGFELSEREVELRIHDVLQLDFNLVIGQTSQAVQVTAATPLLQDANANLGQVIDTRLLQELPTQHGSVFSLVYLEPGVTNTYRGGSQTYSTDALQTIFASGVSMNGTPASKGDYTIDGTPNTQTTWGNSFLNSPPADAVQEFKVETAFDASVGHTSGTIMNVVLKSGGNQLHGSAFDFVRNTSWNANDFFSNQVNQPPTPFSYYRYGGSFGGPVYIPKVYDGRNRTFFFISYETYDLAEPDPFTGSVPTAAEDKGDFSALLALGPQYQIYDPATIAPAGNGRFSIQPFAGNIIPAGRISPIAQAILKQFPAPNATGTPDGVNNYANQNYQSPEHYYNKTLKMDQNIGDRQRLSGRFSQNQNLQGPYRKWWPGPTSGENYSGIGREASVDYTYSVKPSVVLNLRAGYTRYPGDHSPDRLGFDPATLGFSSQFTSLLTQKAFPTVNIGGLSSMAFEGISFLIDNDYSLFAGALIQHGSHGIKVGADLRSYRKNSNSPGNASGNFNFDSTYTQGPFDNSPSSPDGGIGQGLAAFLLGIPSSGSIDHNATAASQSTYYALYFQDDWRATRKLTLNYGLRWEYEGPTTERYNRSVTNFNFNAAQPINAQAQANYALNPDPALPVNQFQVRGGLDFAGVGGQSNYLWNQTFNTFAPRLGFAYKAASDVVIRGGFGVFPIQIGLPGGNDVIQPGFSQTTQLVPTLNNGQTFIATLNNPFPNGALSPVGSSLGVQTFLGKGVSFYIPDAKRPYTMQWSLNVQKVLPGKVLVEIGYVGSRSLKLQVSRNFNALPDQYLSTSPVRDQTTINYLTANVPNPLGGLLPGTGLNGNTISRAQLLAPYPEFTSVTASDYQGYSSYNALQLRAEHRFSHGFMAQAAYSWSKEMDATSYLNPADPLPYYVISPNDRTQTLTFTGIFEFPVGRGKAFLGNTNRAANAVLGGWEIGPELIFHTGYPIPWGNVLFNGNIKNIPLPSSQRTIDRWFNTNAGFVTDPAKQLADNLRTFPTALSGVRTSGENIWNMSLIKNVTLKERYKVEFRAEAFNLFNSVAELGAPFTSPTSSAFGQVYYDGELPRTIQLALKFVF
ncbi:MAG TPA: carboxypeptidase-like regulatory domain-containing protein [Terriglobia bacterium]|nr:carboxypeptidase-like regulatory domain-containing protein [Terriglobia bacterium]